LRKYLLHIVLPIFTGILIYTLWGSKRLIVYKWLSISFSSYITQIQNNSVIRNIKVPDWVKFNVPDGLWLYSLTTLIIFIWRKKISIHSLPWILLCPFLAFGSEIGQGLKIIPGTFDVMDLLAYSLATVAASLHLINRKYIQTKLITIKFKKHEKKLS